ncbi:MAG: hypothetical protein Q8Q28_12385 [Pseudomonadota bacterium]|nr:hypothetical protein [Pseudomonadota bacterium]
MRRLLLLLLALWPLALAAAPATQSADKIATRIWYAADGQGGARLLWFLPPERWGHGWRLEDDQGNVLADRVAPTEGFDPGQEGGAIALGLRVMGDWDYAKTAGLAVELKDLPSRRAGFVLRRLDARGQPDGARLTTAAIDLGHAARPPRPPKELSGEATPQGVKLFWRPQPGRLPVLAYTVERDDGRATTRLHEQALFLGNTWAQPSPAFVDAKAPSEGEASYLVRAVDVLGRASPAANVRVFVPDFTALLPPRAP